LQHKLGLLHKNHLAVREQFSGYKSDCDEGFLYVHSITYNKALPTSFSLQILPDLGSSYIPDNGVQVGIQYTYGRLRKCEQGPPAEIQIPEQWNLICFSMTTLITCCTHQQYSSATFISLRFHSDTEKKIQHMFKKNVIQILFFNCINLKLLYLKLCKSGSVCSPKNGIVYILFNPQNICGVRITTTAQAVGISSVDFPRMHSSRTVLRCW
jgi:hypothetical protein